jgi:hypothetical protein
MPGSAWSSAPAGAPDYQYDQYAPPASASQYAPPASASQYAPPASAGRHDQYAQGGQYDQYAQYAQGSQYDQYAQGGQYDQYAQGGQYAPGVPPRPYDQYAPGAPTGHTQGAVAPRRPFRLDLHRLSRVDQTVGGATLIVLISLFLPWFGFSALGESFSASGTTSHGYLVLVVILAVLMIAYLILRAGWDEFPLSLPIAHAPLLLIGTGLQFLLVLIGFFDVPGTGLSWEIGAYLAMIGSVTAAAPLVVPAIRSWQASR